MACSPSRTTLLAGGGLLALVAALALATFALVAPARSAQPTPVPANVTGMQLFAAKGCVTCHRNGNVARGPNAITLDTAPDLTAYRNDPAFLRRWLADPSAVKPRTQMPNLDLKPAEIEALVAFINSPPTPGP